MGCEATETKGLVSVTGLAGMDGVCFITFFDCSFLALKNKNGYPFGTRSSLQIVPSSTLLLL